jgi:hypothetical protein
MLALDAKHGHGQERVQTQLLRGIRVTSLSGPRTPYAYTIADGNWLILGTTPDAVASLVAGRAQGDSTEFNQVRAGEFADAETFTFVDLNAIAACAAKHRSAITRRLAEGRGGSPALAEHDLDQALALIGLFRSAFLANHVEPDYSAARQVLGIRLRDSERQP